MRIKFKIIAALLYVFIVAPIWYYLLYQILAAIDASELTWFLYWVYVPIGVLASIISELLKIE